MLQMKWKLFVYNSIMVSTPKNIVQFLVGTILFTMLFGWIDIIITLVGLVGFILSYSSVYILNDLRDLEEDRRDQMKIKWKMIANGSLSVRNAVVLYFVFLISGLSVSFLVSPWFFLIMFSLLALNAVYSVFKLKRWMPAAAVFLILMQFLKFSSGWFVLTTSLNIFPFWLIMMLSLAYTSIFVGYKKKFKREFLKEQKYLFVVLALLLIFCYGMSIISYSFPLSMVLLLLFCLSWVLISKIFRIKHYKNLTIFIFYLFMLPVIVLSFLAVAHPSVTVINNGLTEGISNVINVLPYGLGEMINAMKDSPTVFSDLNEIINLKIS